MVLVQLTYSHEGKDVALVYNLLDSYQMEQMRKTLIFAANKRVVVTIQAAEAKVSA